MALGNRGGALQAGERGFGGVWVRDARLALAGIAEAAGLQDRGDTGFSECAVQITRPVDGGERRGGEAEVAQETFLGQPVLGDLQRAPARADLAGGAQPVERAGGDVLEFVGDDVDRSGESIEGRGSGGPRLAEGQGRAGVAAGQLDDGLERIDA